MYKLTPTLRKLIYLVLIFIIGFILLISFHLFFLELVEKSNNKSKNLKAKIEIGEYIINDIYKIRSDFYELTTTATNLKGRLLIKKRLDKRILDIKKALKILEKGGVLERTIKLNITNHLEAKKLISYKNTSKSISLEVIDISPKLMQLNLMIKKLLILHQKQDINKKYKQLENFVKLNKKIKRFYKSSPAFFTRLTENTSRLLYEGNMELEELTKEINREKENYSKLEVLLFIIVLFLVLVFSYIIARQININAKKLEHQQASTRGILDGQPNIVVVSDGEHMIDANTSLVKFFDGFNSFEDFKEKHLCICDFFIDIKDENYLIDIDYNGLRWFEYILSKPEKLHKVVMKKNEELRYFTIIVEKKQLDKKNFILIISLTDISKEIHSQKELKKLNDNLENIVNEKTKELQDLNEHLELRVEKTLEENRKKDKRMIQQSRFAALGEMIGNIAHQWRQPLSAISSTASSMQLQLQLKLDKKEDINKSYESIISYVNFLSQTIEDFRSFFKEDKEKIKFDLIDVLNNTISITEASYKNQSIKLDLDLKEKELISFGFPNELSQVYLNILNNAKDALENIPVEQRYVRVISYSNKNENIIEICDNAGGIPEKIKEKIFDPYFTTKHQSQGTGIGLYMSKDIIEKHMIGSLSLKNKEIKINEETYIGASFIIKLPKI